MKSKIMSLNTYFEGDRIEDCLKNIIEARNGKNEYENIDDSVVLAIFTLFPDEMSNWIMFGAYEEKYKNLYKEKNIEVFGNSKVPRREQMLRKVSEYFNKEYVNKQMNKVDLIRKKEMLEKLGVKNLEIPQDKGIDKEELAQLATSEIAMEQLDGSFDDIKAAYNDIKNPNKKGLEEK